MTAPITLQNDLIAVDFRRHDDRYAHTISLRSDGRAITMLDSREGARDLAWPPSPPLQQIEVDCPGGNHRALLVGMAGRSHWSVGIELQQGAAAVRFDVACRIKVEPNETDMIDPDSAILRSTYLTAATVLEQSDAALLLESNMHRLRIESLDAGPGSDAVRLSLFDGEIQLSPPHEPGPLPRTIRWRYQISCIR